MPNDRVLLSKGYGGGAKLLQVSRTEKGEWEVAEVWSNSRVLRTKFCNVVLHGEHVYGLSDGILECVELASGRRVWKERPLRARTGPGRRRSAAGAS